MSSTYWIERSSPDRLRLFRDGCLVDEDVELDGDSRADIERWGTGVAWTEEYTGIARWVAQPGGDQWQVLIGVAYRYVRWQFEDRTVWDEVGPDGWVSRQVEVGPDGRYLAAAALSEVLAARDADGVSAVTTYEQVYGIAPETDLGPEGEPYPMPVLAVGLADPELRSTALEALTNQPDANRVDAVARTFLADSDPMVRSKAAGMVSFLARPGALEVLMPLADDPAPHVRMVLGWYLGGLCDLAAEPTLRVLLTDPDEQVRKFAARGLARLNSK